ncbi:MAG: prephenate dehydratase [Armatimonadetes bacterium]|nr:prephenate dehydratase [Armatimonadota bacterium]
MDIGELRAQIDDIDRKIVELLRRRAQVAVEIGRLKRQNGAGGFDPVRESVVLESVARMETEPLTPKAVQAVFSEIISACRALEETLRVAFLGPQHTFSHLAAVRRFGREAEYIDCASVTEVFEAVERGRAGVGVVPVENSLAGAVPETLDCFLRTALQIVGEHYERIEHCLLGVGPVEKIRTIYTQPHAEAQCRRWLREHFPQADLIPQPSTAAAARAAAEAGETAAAIGPAAAARPYGLEVLERGIEDDSRNWTRFFIIGRGRTTPTSKDKTSLVFSVPHRAGSLHEALTPLRDHKVNMTMIQSRPVPGRLWTYAFFVDIEGHQEDPAISQALEELRARASDFAILGSYPAAQEPEG